MDNTENLSLLPRETFIDMPAAAQLVPTSQAPVAKLLEAVINKGVTSENVGALEKLVGLYERMQDKDAERQFNSAFVALQAELPVIVASTIIPNRGKYERFEDVMRQIGPALIKNGFSVSFSMDFKETRVVETCHLMHVGGHSKSNSFAVRSGRADTETQADCKAATTAKRNALLNCLNIVIRQDALLDEDNRDAAIEGAEISGDQAQYLKELLAETKSDTGKFLAMAGVDSVEKITSGSYDVLVRALLMKRKS
jgi:hypothetical protein